MGFILLLKYHCTERRSYINGVLLETEDYPISPIIVNDYAQDIYLNGRPIDRAKARFESEEDTCNSYLVGNGAFLVL